MKYFKYLMCIATLLTIASNVQASEKVLTTIFNKNNQVVLKITESDLAKYPQDSFETETPWFPQKSVFKGILFKEVLKKANISENSQLQIVAWDNFTSQVPAKDAFEFNTILTTHINGQRITLRDKGPFFLMYPLTNPSLRTGVYYNRSVWQIKEIHEK